MERIYQEGGRLIASRRAWKVAAAQYAVVGFLGGVLTSRSLRKKRAKRKTKKRR